ncbi:MAG: hypothetical protein IT436_00265 [Phycisphaerales bacterium]|nr:hypothetical protein [Phycisphaerales bacterium]
MPGRMSWLLVMVGVLSGCTTVIIPPPDPADPVDVWLIDYGYHAALALPDGENAAREYAYGEWDWFALNHDRWYRLPLLIFPRPAGVGRGAATIELGPGAIAGRPGPDGMQVMPIRVARARAAALRSRLDELFARGPVRLNERYGMEFAPSEACYSAVNNCNAEVADWLRELDCRVLGPTFFAEFEVRPAPARR